MLIKMVKFQDLNFHVLTLYGNTLFQNELKMIKISSSIILKFYIFNKTQFKNEAYYLIARFINFIQKSYCDDIPINLTMHLSQISM